MTDSRDRRSHPRLASSARIIWATAGSDLIQIDRLRDVSLTGARVDTDSVPRVGDEIRFELLDDDGEKFATGLARIAWVDSVTGMGISFLALGVDPALVELLASANRPPGPPQLPNKRPPPMPRSARKGPPALPRTSRAADPPAPAVEREEFASEIEPLAVHRPRMIIGIDLGTTTTCASYVVDGRPRIIPGRTGTSTIPSMITFDAGGVYHVGQRAADRHILQPLRTVYGSKRLLGRTYTPELAAELQRHFAYPLGEAPGQRFGVRIDDGVISMDSIATKVLEEVRSTAEAHLGVPVDAAVITVPAYFTEVQRDAVRRAAQDAKLTVHRLVNEPTAAAVAYGRTQETQSRIAVWDFGGGTFDFSIVDVSHGQFEVVTTGGDCFVGGADFDDLLASYLLGEFQRMERVDVDPSPQQIARLRDAAEVAKRSLSVQTEVVVELPEFTANPKRTLRVEVTRERFDVLTGSLIDRAVAIATEVMQARGLTPADVDDVLLVGGTTRIPAVQQAVADLFQRRPSKRINPDEAVALGAALLADEIGSANGLTLLDILPMSVGQGVAGLRFEPIVERNQRLPAQREVTLQADLLGTVTMPIFQGESPDVSRNEYICSAVVEDKSLWDKGRVTLRLSFDEHCVMAVDARDARTGRALPLRLDRTRPLADILRELGTFEGPEQETWRLPESRLGKVLGKLFKLFGG